MKVRFLFLGLAALFIAILVSCHKNDIITLNKTSLFLENGGLYADTSIGDTITLVATPYPNKKIIWKSSNPDIATVTPDGLVTAISKGKATITASVQNRKQTATCFVTVADYREKWVGDWDFITEKFKLYYGISTWDTTYYSGKIIFGRTSNELYIHYAKYDLMSVGVFRDGLDCDFYSSFYPYVTPSPESFVGSSIIHLRFAWGMHTSDSSKLDIYGIKRNKVKSII